jgi:hypothetical protein
VLEPIALDIETTGLNPSKDRIISYALWEPTYEWFEYADPDKREVTATHYYDPEQWLLWNMPVKVAGHPVVTWNGDEFDMHFLMVRAGEQDTEVDGLHLHPLGRQKGKYGGQLWRATWYDQPVIDVAPWYRNFAERENIEWSLMAVGQRLGLEPYDLPKSIYAGRGLRDLPESELEMYNLSHARMTYALYRMGGL